MKKVLIVNGSPRKNGISSQLIDIFTDVLGKNVNVRIYNAYDMKIKPCTGCGKCSKSIGCIFDDMDGFKDDFENCDLFFLATPVYFSSVPAPLKVLIDRFQCYYSMRFDHKMKPAIKKYRPSVFVVTSGSDGKAQVNCVISMLKQAFSILNTDTENIFIKSNTDKNNLEKSDIDRFSDFIKKIIENIFDDRE